MARSYNWETPRMQAVAHVLRTLTPTPTGYRRAGRQLNLSPGSVRAYYSAWSRRRTTTSKLPTTPAKDTTGAWVHPAVRRLDEMAGTYRRWLVEIEKARDTLNEALTS